MTCLRSLSGTSRSLCLIQGRLSTFECILFSCLGEFQVASYNLRPAPPCHRAGHWTFGVCSEGTKPLQKSLEQNAVMGGQADRCAGHFSLHRLFVQLCTQEGLHLPSFSLSMSFQKHSTQLSFVHHVPHFDFTPLPAGFILGPTPFILPWIEEKAVHLHREFLRALLRFIALDGSYNSHSFTCNHIYHQSQNLSGWNQSNLSH